MKHILVLFLIALFAGARANDEAPADVQINEDEPIAQEEVEEPVEEVDPEAATLEGFSAEQVEEVKKGEQFEFQAEVHRMMDILINSLYSHREIFLRELISNASDALDKIRFKSLTDKSQLGENPEFEIRIKFDKKAKTLTVSDTGVGMTKDELKANLGIVAHTGTTQFLDAMNQGQSDMSLIGQFGVGFYSVYLVADTVTVISKSNDDEQYIWKSAANKVFTVSKDPRGNTLGRGSQVVLHLKDDAAEFLDQQNLEKVVTKYSLFINYPIYLYKMETVTKEVPVEEEAKPEADEPKEDEDELDVSDEEEEDKPKTKKVTEEVWEWKQVNEVKPIWTRSIEDITEEEYDEFYKSITKDSKAPLTHIHFAAEGEISFKSILYVPSSAPSDLYDKYYAKMNGLKLFVRRVLISDEFEDFLPRYLSFIRGVVDSDDLPLNVSRETLSKSRVLKVMGKKLTRKALEMLKKLADETEKKTEKEEQKEEGTEEQEEEDSEKGDYYDFWREFGKSIRLGVLEDQSNKAKLTKLLRFLSSKDDETPVSLQKYVDRMKEGQKSIYYITGENLASVRKSPFLEKALKRGFEVLFMVDPLDEYVMTNMHDYEGFRFQSVSKEGLKFDDESADETARLEAMKKDYDQFCKWLKDLYGDKVGKVEVSNRLAQSPMVLVTSQYGWSANMERIMKAQTFGDAQRAGYMISKKTVEINPLHPVVRQLKDKVTQDDSSESVKDLAWLLFDNALVQSGFSIEEMETFGARVDRILRHSLEVAADEPVMEEEAYPVPETPAEEEPAEPEEAMNLDSEEEDPEHEEL